MKKLCTALFTLLFVLSMVTAAYADNTVSLDELNLDITLEDDAWYITRDTQPDDPVWEALGSSPEDVLAYMEEHGVYLCVFPSDFSYEVDLYLEDSPFAERVFDYNRYQDEQIERWFSAMVDSQDESGIGISDFEIYQASDAKYARLCYDPQLLGQSDSPERFATIFNGRCFLFVLFPISDSTSDDGSAFLRSVVEGACFTKQLNPPETAAVEQQEDNSVKTALKAAFHPLDILEDAVIGGIFGLLAYSGFKGISKKRKNDSGSAHL